MTASEIVQRPAYPIDSVENALKLILLFKNRRKLSVAEAAEELGVARSTAHRLLAMLEFYRFVQQRDQRGPYEVGAALLEVGFGSLQGMELRTIARPYLEQLRDAVGETVYLGMRFETRTIIVDTVESTQALRLTSRTGALFSAYGSAIGRVLLATLADDEVCGLYPHDALPPTDPKNPHLDVFPNRAALLAELRTIRNAGYAVNYDRPEVGSCAVAVAVCDHRGHGRASLAVGAPTSRVRRRDLPSIGKKVVAVAHLLGANLP